MSRKLILLFGLLLAATVILAAVHLAGQDGVECMVIESGEGKISVSFENLTKETFSGELTDGKGDVTSRSYTGILLKTLLEQKGIDLSGLTGITVRSADNYSVELTAQEVLQGDKVYLAVTADGETIPGIDPGTPGVQMIVFGDPNSRRCVRYARFITIQ